MGRDMRKRWFGFGLALVLALSARGVHAQAWPSQPVKIISPFSPGGTADVLCRMIADQFSAAFGQPFYVESHAGAGGMIGSRIAATAPADGYTLVMSGNASHIIAPAISRSPQYDGVADFTHIAFLGGSPVGLVVNPSLPVNSLPEFIAYLTKSPQVMDYTSSGVGTNGFLFGAEFAQREGLKLNHIPYKGGGPAMIDLLAGHVKIATVTFSSASELVRSGKLRALALSSDQRLVGFPDIPTFGELGYPDMISLSWFALSGPKGLPRNIVDALNREVGIAVKQPEIQRRAEQDGIQMRLMSPEETTRYFEAETARWAPIAKASRKDD
jgi:tripartite-type tricarboxylate transporter receptor subunit TctC